MLKYLNSLLGRFEKRVENAGKKSPLRWHRSLGAKVSFVVAVYNVEPYIREFLASVTSQTTGLRNLEVILVDDGSTDRSGEIAQDWARRYPRTFQYIRQENAGAAAARNTGLDHATGEWVSFPDPDDMLPPKWLAHFDREIRRKRSKPLLMVTRLSLILREQTREILNTHPLRRFYNKRTVTRTEKMGDYIRLAVHGAFIRRSEIIRTGLRFDPRIKPSFEDGHFINRLILACPGQQIVRLSVSRYIYRKRSAQTSLLDGSREDPLWLTDQLRFGYLDLLKQASLACGRVPDFVQRTVLYELGWRYRHLMDRPDRESHLSIAQKAECESLIQQILAYIDAEIILGMNIGVVFEEIKVGC